MMNANLCVVVIVIMVSVTVVLIEACKEWCKSVGPSTVTMCLCNFGQPLAKQKYLVAIIVPVDKYLPANVAII